jgi:hypothetical protein
MKNRPPEAFGCTFKKNREGSRSEFGLIRAEF